MSQKSAIEWTERTWNPITGCVMVSPGCKHCYALAMSRRLAAMGHRRYAAVVENGKWNGVQKFHGGVLLQPFGWKRPTTVFVCSMSDLFADGVKTEWLDAVFAVMAANPHITFQVLTKRPARARSYVCELYLNLQSRLIAAGLDYQLPESAVRILAEVPWTAENPLPNVWIGTSTEDQRRFDERLPDLLATPAAVRFLSMEPLLGAVEMPLGLGARGLNWVIVGGESGPGARPMHPDWARALRDHCVLDKVPFFFKQWGGVNKKKAGRLLDGRTYDEMPAAAKVAA